jgi:hypothetical protein
MIVVSVAQSNGLFEAAHIDVTWDPSVYRVMLQEVFIPGVRVCRRGYIPSVI